MLLTVTNLRVGMVNILLRIIMVIILKTFTKEPLVNFGYH